MNNYETGQLLTRIQEGDISAYEVLYSNTYTLVCSVAYSVLHDQSAAEDIAQNVFSTIWNHKTAYQHSRNPMLGCIPSLTMLQWIMSKAENMNLASRNRCSYLLTIRKPLKIL